MVTALGSDVEIDGLISVPDGRLLAQQQPLAAIQVDEDTLAVMRVERLPNGDALSISYAAPDYLFELKPALALLQNVAEHSRLKP